MLGSAGNNVQAGIRFDADLSAVERTKRRISSLSRDVDVLTGGFLALGEGSDRASRGFTRLTTSSTSANAGLAGLQAQIVSTAAAQETLENQSGDLRSALRSLADAPDDWAVGDALNKQQQKVIDAATKQLDDIQFGDQLVQTSDGENVVDSIDDYRKVVEDVVGMGDGFTDDDRAPFLPDIEPTQQVREELNKIDKETNKYGKDGIWQSLFRPIGADEIHAPTDTTSSLFPESTDFDKHIFHDLFQSGEFEDVGEIVEGVKSGDLDLKDHLTVGPSMQEKDPNIFDLFPDGAIPKHREGGQRELFQHLPGGIQEDLRENLKDAGVTDLDDLFTVDNNVLNNALLESVGDQSHTLTADDVRSEALKDLRNAYPVPESDQFYEDLAKDLDNIEIPLGELEGTRKIDAQRDILQSRQSRFQTADDVPAGFMRAAQESEQLREHLDIQGLESVSDVAEADIGVLNRLPGFSPERSQKLKSHAQHLQKTFNSFDNELTEGLVQVMGENEEIMNYILHSSSFDDAINSFEDIDEDGLARLNTMLAQRSDEILETVLDPGEVVSQIDPTKTREDVHRDLRQVDGIGESLNDRQIEMMSGIISDLGGGSDDVVTPQPVTRETLGLRTMQEMMDTDPSREPDRVRSLEGIMEAIYDPKTGIQSSILDDEGIMTGKFYDDLSHALPEHLTTPGGFDEGSGPDVARQVTQGLMDRPEELIGGTEDFFGEDSVSLGALVGESVEQFDFDDPNVLEKATSETEQLLPLFSDWQAAQVAPGVQSTARRTEGFSSTQDLLPGRNILGLDGSESNYQKKLKEAYRDYFKALRGNIGDLRQTQQSSSILQGGAASGFVSAFTGNRERPRGLLGGVIANASEMSGVGPRRFNQIQKSIEAFEEGYDGLLPLLEATSIRLGSVNVNFESMGIMLFKLTAMLGPVAAGIAGLATAAVGATAALGGLVAVGAVEYLGEMEDTMAGINNKQEAMAELGDVLTDMAWEALMPLRDARLGGDGPRGYELFIDALRGGLTLLNRVANILAYIVELDVVGEEFERFVNFLMDPSGDSALARNLADLVEEVLPLINDILIVIMGNFGEMTGFVGNITRNLGDRILDVAREMGPVLALIASYGAGFFDMALLAVGYVAMMINYISGTVDVVASLIETFTGLSVESRRLMYVIGGVIGVINVLSRVASFLAGLKATLAVLAFGLSKAYAVLTASTVTLTVAMKALAIYTAITIGSMMTLMYAIEQLRDIEIGEEGWFSDAVIYTLVAFASLLPLVVAVAKGLSTVVTIVGIIWAKVKPFVALLKFLAPIIKAIVLSVLGISAGWAAVITAVLILIPIVADLIYYLRTGDSFLINWEHRLAQIAGWLETIRDRIESIPGIETATDALSMAGPGSVGRLTDRAEMIEEDNGNNSSSNNDSESNGSTRSVPGTAQATGPVTANINVNAARSERVLSKIIRREVDNLLGDIIRRDL